MGRPRLSDSPEGRVRQEEKYRRILDAALVVFADKGYTEAKIAEIAKVAGVADGTIYLYFANKDDLLISLFETKLEEINLGLGQRLAGLEGAVPRLKAIIDYHLGMAAEHPDLATFISIELRRSSRFMKAYAKQKFAEYLDHFGRAIEAGKASGEFRDGVSAATFKHLLFGALDQAVLIWLSNPKRRPEDLVDVGDKLFEFVRRGLAAEA